jgi:hypothetical protein
MSNSFFVKTAECGRRSPSRAHASGRTSSRAGLSRSQIRTRSSTGVVAPSRGTRREYRFTFQDVEDGRKLHKFIQHAIGSTEVQMTDQQLEKKFSDLAEGILAADQTRALMDKCWHVEQLDSAGDIALAALPR